MVQKSDRRKYSLTRPSGLNKENAIYFKRKTNLMQDISSVLLLSRDRRDRRGLFNAKHVENTWQSFIPIYTFSILSEAMRNSIALILNR